MELNQINEFNRYTTCGMRASPQSDDKFGRQWTVDGYSMTTILRRPGGGLPWKE
jgi:hypothetical protein